MMGADALSEEVAEVVDDLDNEKYLPVFDSYEAAAVLTLARKFSIRRLVVLKPCFTRQAQTLNSRKLLARP